ncbi:MAG: hypothetical protein IJF69_00920 [Clostridia bacterium]|nr:hypothetical protein [Clostridia bacterium]
MEEHKGIDIKLLRIFNILAPKYYMVIVTLSALVSAVAVTNHIKDKTSVSMLMLSIFIYITVVVVVEILIMIHKSPKKIEMLPNEINFVCHLDMKPRRGIHTGYFPVKVLYSVCDIKRIEFYQNRIEKVFNVGHISFSGKVFIEAKRDTDRIEIDQPFCIYGIPNFEQFKKEYER